MTPRPSFWHPHATAYTLAHDRVLRPATSLLADPALPSDLRRVYDKFAQRSCLAA